MPRANRDPSTPPHLLISTSQRALRVPRRKIRELITFVARRTRARLREVDVAVVGRRKMASLNRRWTGRGGATDVLSFDLSDSRRPGLCAQIVVCGDEAIRQAQARGHSTERELLLYVLHGLLHLVGYDDANPQAAARMHETERKLLGEFLSQKRRRHK